MEPIKSELTSLSEINVTPFVDVMLVLLIIFMVTAPLMLNGIKLTLPKTREVNKVNLTSNQVILSYTKGKKFFLGNKLLPEEKKARSHLAIGRLLHNSYSGQELEKHLFEIVYQHG